MNANTKEKNAVQSSVSDTGADESKDLLNVKEDCGVLEPRFQDQKAQKRNRIKYLLVLKDQRSWKKKNQKCQV